MTELERLREQVRKDLAELRHSEKECRIAEVRERYGRQGYTLPRNHIEDVVRSIAKEFGFDLR